MNLPYQSRKVAGRILGECLKAGRSWTAPLVLALPRGGVPIGVEVAQCLGAELDVMSVRLIELPGQSELILGTVTSGEYTQRNEPIAKALGVPEEEFRQRRDREIKELRRLEGVYRGSRLPPMVCGRSVILVDDGLGTATKMKAAVRVLQQQNPIEIVVAAPVGSATAVATLWREADEVFCPATPDPFFSIGLFYRSYMGLTEEEVAAMLREVWSRPGLLSQKGEDDDEGACVV